MAMLTEVKFAGFGGQGILVSAKLLAYAAMKQDLNVAWVPSYGPEMRGGTAYCTVVISDRRIGSPIIKYPTYLIAMNRPSFEKFVPHVKPGGLVLINTSLIRQTSRRKDIDELLVPANKLALEAGSDKCANIVALSAFTARTGIVRIALLKDIIEQEFSHSKALFNINQKAFEKGAALAAIN